MKVRIPSALRSYTDSAQTEADGATLAEVVAALDLQYPGIAFRMIDEQGRIRRHIRFFVDGQQVRDLLQPADADGELVIVQALSGG
jgi:molybdopterin converting factor small subunit